MGQIYLVLSANSGLFGYQLHILHLLRQKDLEVFFTCYIKLHVNGIPSSIQKLIPVICWFIIHSKEQLMIYNAFQVMTEENNENVKCSRKSLYKI